MPEPFEADWLCKLINSFSEIKLMNLIKSPKLIFDDISGIGFIFVAEFVFFVFTCMLILNNVFNPLITIRW